MFLDWGNVSGQRAGSTVHDRGLPTAAPTRCIPKAGTTRSRRQGTNPADFWGAARQCRALRLAAEGAPSPGPCQMARPLTSVTLHRQLAAARPEAVAF